VSSERGRLGAPAAWNCRDVKFFIDRISFDQLGHERAAALDAVETNGIELFVTPFKPTGERHGVGLR
jgi:hypothetical protein